MFNYLLEIQMAETSELNLDRTQLIAGTRVASAEFENDQLTGPLEFPIENAADYRGRIVFAVVEEEETDIAGLMSDFNVKQTETGSRDNSLDERGEPVNVSPEERQRRIQDLANARQQQSGSQTVIRNNRALRLSDKKVKLYLPQGINIADGVQYENTDLGVIGALAARGAGAAMEATGVIGGIGDGVGSIIDAFKGTSSNSGVGRLAANRVASAFGDQTAAGVKSVTRVTLNPNTRALFKAVNLRSFAFTFKLIPQSSQEARRITEIIKFFRSELYPEEIPLGGEQDGAGGVSIGYKFPNRFQISMLYNNVEVATRLLPCYLESFQAVYNPTAMSMHRDGNFQEVDITLNFRESRTLSRKDITEGNY